MEVVKTIFRLDNNLPTQIIENKGFPRQKSRQLPSAEANLEGCQKHQSALKLPYHSTKAVHWNCLKIKRNILYWELCVLAVITHLLLVLKYQLSLNTETK